MSGLHWKSDVDTAATALEIRERELPPWPAQVVFVFLDTLEAGLLRESRSKVSFFVRRRVAMRCTTV